MTPLVARTRHLDQPVDLVRVAGAEGTLFVRDGEGLAGRGEVARTSPAAAAATLAAIEVDDEVGLPGCGPVALGALPFLPDAPAELIVPSLVVGRSADGTRFVTTVAPADAGPPDLASIELAAPSGPGPGRFSVTSSRPPADWCDAVARATATIRSGVLDKVVLTREVVVEADEPFPVDAVLERLRRGFPSCFVFSVAGFVGASPELLVSRTGDVVRAQPMAGTAPRSGDPDIDARASAGLFASSTYRHEHQVTIDAVHDGLLPFCSYIDYEAEPSVVTLPNLFHLATTVAGRLSDPPASILELVAALHPTPAICGTPRDAARALIAELEELDRGRYAGTVGWTDRHGNGAFAVSVRCGEIDGTTARIYGGNGIVGDSIPAVELTETRAKLSVLLGVLLRP